MWTKGKKFCLQSVFLSVISICCILPLFFLIQHAFGQNGAFSLWQFEQILLYDRRFYVWFWNSVGYTAAILLGNIPISFLAAYGFSQFHFPGRKVLFSLNILLMLLPFQATVVPQYLTFQALNLVDTRWAVILPGIFSAFGVFLLTEFMQGIDSEILQAAQLDGAGWTGILWHIFLPVCKPAIDSLALLQLLSSWSMIDQPLLFLRSEQILPLSLELSSQIFGESAFAAGIIFAFLPVTAYLFCGDALEQGICLGSVK